MSHIPSHAWECWRTEGQTDGWTDRRYRTYYLPCFAIDNKQTNFIFVQLKTKAIKKKERSRNVIMIMKYYFNQIMLMTLLINSNLSKFVLDDPVDYLLI